MSADDGWVGIEMLGYYNLERGSLFGQVEDMPVMANMSSEFVEMVANSAIITFMVFGRDWITHNRPIGCVRVSFLESDQVHPKKHERHKKE